MKQCTKCKEWKALDDFYKHPSGKYGRAPRCKVCLLAEMKDRYPNYDWRSARYRRLFGISVADYDQAFKMQGGACAICGGVVGSKPGCRFAVDHDHASGKFRGLLCGACNTGLGKFKDSPSLLERAAAYIRQHKGAK